MSEKEEKIPIRRFKEFEHADAWEQRKLGELANIVRGASPRPIQDPKWFDDESDVGWLRIADVTEQDGRIHHLEQHISKLGQEKTRVLTEPHLLLSIAATVGKPVVNYVKTGVHDGFLIFLEPKFNRVFMFQWLEMFRPKWQKYGQPGSQVNLNSDLVKNQEIALPREEEQQKIGAYFAKLDHLITLHQRKLEKIKSLKKAYLSEMFPAKGECKPKRRFAGYTDAWEQCKLGEVCLEIGDGLHSAPLYDDAGKYYFINGNNLIEGKIIIDKLETPKVSNEVFEKNNSQLDNNTVLLSINGTIGNLAYYQGENVMLGKSAAYLKVKNIEKKYLYTVLQTPMILRQFDLSLTGTTIKNLGLSAIKNTIVYMPIKEEQERIGEYFSQLDHLITLHQRKFEKLQSLKQAYLNEMFV